MAGIIKLGSQTIAPTGRATVAYQFDDMGQSYLDGVRGEAAKILAEARAEAVRIKAKAAEDGKQAALQAVEATLRSKIDEQLKSLLAALGQAVSGIEQSRQAWQKHWENYAIQLSVAIAERIIRRELVAQPQIAAALVREALELAAGQRRIVLRLSPADHAGLAGQAELWVKQLGLLAEPQIIADPEITPGGCRVETEHGSIDERIEVQLARVAEELLS
jgi:flagellar biosynthesis/type III secretory pathway protein FliH